MKFFDWMYSLFDNRTEYEKNQDKEIINLIKKTKQKYPSFRIVGRGTIMIDPDEIVNSDGFKHDLKRAKELVDNNILS